MRAELLCFLLGLQFSVPFLDLLIVLDSRRRGDSLLPGTTWVPTEMFVPLSHGAGPRSVRLRRGPGGHWRRRAEDPLLRHRPLPHSDGCFVKTYPAETTEAFLDGHVSAFTFLGGVPHDRRQFVLPVPCCLLTNRTMKRDSWPPSSGIPAATHRWI